MNRIHRDKPDSADSYEETHSQPPAVLPSRATAAIPDSVAARDPREDSHLELRRLLRLMLAGHKPL